MTPHKLRMSTERRKPRWWPVNQASDIVCLHLQKHLMTELNQKLTKYMPQMFLRCSSKWKLLCKEFGGEEGVYLRECLPLIYFPPYSINFALGSYICFCGCPSVRACCLHMLAKLIESHFTCEHHTSWFAICHPDMGESMAELPQHRRCFYINFAVAMYCILELERKCRVESVPRRSLTVSSIQRTHFC